MSDYNYKEGKKRIKDILNNKLDVVKRNEIPKGEAFTFENAYYGWVSAIFVDIRESSKIFSKEDKVEVSKMIRSFTSEIIEILRGDDNEREIGIRGDCVYAIYTTPSQSAIYELANKTWYINTYMEMLNKLLKEKRYSEIQVGIGMATSEELVIKAGRKNVGINSAVWIGEAVTKASNLSGLGNKNGLESIVYSENSYNNFIDELIKAHGENAKIWFKKNSTSEYGIYYSANIVKTEFRNWINQGMPE